MNSVLFILTLLTIYRLSEKDKVLLVHDSGDNPSSKLVSDEDAAENQRQLVPGIKSLRVQAIVRYRYARTRVYTEFYNPTQTTQEVIFDALVPETAFISGFQIETDGKKYDSYVKEKEVTKRIYPKLIQHHNGSRPISASNTQRFSVPFNLKACGSVIFNLTYEELLVRRAGQYRYVVNLNPGQVVPDLSVSVFLEESGRLALSVNEHEMLDEKNHHHAKINMLNKYTAIVKYAPNLRQQRALSKTGVSGQFVVSYDVMRQPKIPGKFLVKDGYFVQFFAMDKLSPLSKHVIYVLDLSGSMIGRKIEQMKDAMYTILEDLRPHDYFSLITYSTDVKIWLIDPFYLHGGKLHYDSSASDSSWMSTIVPANDISKKIVNLIIRVLWAEGATNTHEALKQAVKLSNIGSMKLKEMYPEKAHPEPIIILFTDGAPSEGETNTTKIIQQITKKNKAAIFSVALDQHADFNFLKTLSYHNSGFSKRIPVYKNSDLAAHFIDFCHDVDTPVLANVSFNFQPDQVNFYTLTETSFPYLFSGSELVVSGHLHGAESKLASEVTGRSSEGGQEFNTEYSGSASYKLDRLWAYLTLQQMLQRGTEKAIVLEIALKNKFVTPVSSLVVVRPDLEDAWMDLQQDEEKYGPDKMEEEDFKIVSSILNDGKNSLSKKKGKESDESVDGKMGEENEGDEKEEEEDDDEEGDDEEEEEEEEQEEEEEEEGEGEEMDLKPEAKKKGSKKGFNFEDLMFWKSSSAILYPSHCTEAVIVTINLLMYHFI